MRLKAMELEALNDYEDAEITSVAFHAGEVVPGSLFVCLKGVNADGHDFAEAAEAAGAAAVVSEKPLNVSVPCLIAADSRRQLTLACSALYGRPERKLKMIAVTGTNGKTTTTFIVKSILECAGYKVGLIGTNCVMTGDQSRPASLTTPDPTDLYRILSEMEKSGVEYVVMEASAHALELKKLDAITFDVAALTNLTQDHLDYFGTMERYAGAKRLLFNKKRTRMSVLNVDDAFGRELALESETKLITYGCDNPSDVFAIDLSMSAGGLEYILNAFDDIAEIKFNLPGRFNMYNTLCAAAVASALNIPMKYVVKGIRQVTKIDGRFNMIGTAKCTVIVDFAHTPDGLKNILGAIREFAPQRIITVFGCGGDRDRAKRPLMGETVSALSDVCVVTSDNPRTEDPESIIADVMSGVSRDNCVSIPDRKEAVKYALKIAGSEDIVLVAGKGAENYQEINGVKTEYNDEHYIMELLEENSI